MFLVWTPGTWGEPMLTDGHLISLYVSWLVGWCQKWPLQSGTDPVYSQPKLLMPPPATGSSEFTVGSVMPALDESPRRVSHSLADRELLIRNVLEAVGARREVISEWLWRYRTGTVITGRNSSGVSDDTKDILFGESAWGGDAPAHGRPGGPWSVFLLWILWTWGKPMSTDSTALHECAETNRTSGGEKRDGSGGRVSLPDHQ